MNVKLVFRITGLALLLQAGAMLPPLLVCLRYGEDPAPFLWTIALLLLLGLPLTLLLRNDTRMYARDAYLAVGLIWLEGVAGPGETPQELPTALQESLYRLEAARESGPS